MKLGSQFIVGLALAASCPLASAALPEVTKSPGPGQYGTVNAALTVATNGDTVEIIDNSLPFVEQVIIQNKNNFILRGKAGLSPQPTIQGTGTASPFDAGLKVAFSYNNAVDNLLVQDLIIKAGTGDDVVCDARFWNGATFTNVTFDATGANNALRSQVASTFNSCTFLNGMYQIEHYFGGPIVFHGCTMTGATGTWGFYIRGGSATFDQDCFLSAKNSAATIAIEPGASDWGDPSISLTKCIVTHEDTTEHKLIMIWNGNTNETQMRRLNADQCDFVGQWATTARGIEVDSGVRNGGTQLSIQNSIWWNAFVQVYQIAADKVTPAAFEDYNVFKEAPAGLDPYYTAGPHDTVNLAPADLLYVSPPTDYRVFSDSVAATMKTGATPYSGSKGVGPHSAVDFWPLY